MTKDKTVTMSRELERLAERYEETARGPSPGWVGAEVVAKELRALLAAKSDLVECDACPTSGGCMKTCMKAAPVVERQPEPSLWLVRIPEEPEDPEESPAEYVHAGSTYELSNLLKRPGATIDQVYYTSPPEPVAEQHPIAYMRNEGTPNNLVQCSFTCPGAFGVYRGPQSLSAMSAPVAVLEGWKLVPEVATMDMKNAGWQECERQGVDPESIEMQTVWTAMHLNAPTCLDKVKELNQ